MFELCMAVRDKYMYYLVVGRIIWLWSTDKRVSISKYFSQSAIVVWSLNLLINHHNSLLSQIWQTIIRYYLSFPHHQLYGRWMWYLFLYVVVIVCPSNRIVVYCHVVFLFLFSRGINHKQKDRRLIIDCMAFEFRFDLLLLF